MATDSLPLGPLWSAATLEIRGSLAGDEPATQLAQPFARIGWYPRCDFVLGGEGVAKRHLYLHAARGGVFAVNLAAEASDHHPSGRWLESEEVVVGSHRLAIFA